MYFYSFDTEIYINFFFSFLSTTETRVALWSQECIDKIQTIPQKYQVDISLIGSLLLISFQSHLKVLLSLYFFFFFFCSARLLDL